MTIIIWIFTGLFIFLLIKEYVYRIDKYKKYNIRQTLDKYIKDEYNHLKTSFVNKIELTSKYSNNYIINKNIWLFEVNENIQEIDLMEAFFKFVYNEKVNVELEVLLISNTSNLDYDKIIKEANNLRLQLDLKEEDFLEYIYYRLWSLIYNKSNNWWLIKSIYLLK